MTASLVELLLDTSDLGRALTSDFVDFYVIDRDEMFKEKCPGTHQGIIILFKLSNQ